MDGSDLEIFIDFDLDMDETVTPPAGSFVLLDNTVPLTIDTIDWASATQLTLTSNGSAPPTTPIDISLPAIDQLFRSADLHLVFPFAFTNIGEA